jgi:hypothetical protein
MQISYTEDQGIDAVIVTTATASWTYQLSAGGFSSLLDRDGEEWIGFAPGPSGTAEGAAHVYRGIPNLVHPDDIGHPGHEKCRSRVEEETDAVLISTVSTDGSWAWQWRITESEASLSVTRTPPERSYWFLYEGTPAGRYEPERSFWGSDTEGRRAERPDIFGRTASGGAAITSRRWAYFGHRDLNRVLLCSHLTADGEPSFFAYMRAFENEGMCVFGFGRDQADGPVPCLSGPHRFSVRLVEGSSHDEIARVAASQSTSSISCASRGYSGS